VIEFGALPPEINSGRMYVGAGAGPLLAAASAWAALAGGLMASATGMATVTGGLVGGPWTGPSSAMMGMSHLQFIEWVFQTAATAARTAAAAGGAADAYATAFTATIPPEEVERNQFTTATLIATNFFGVNSAAIAASQAQYEEYWAQDASAMYTYAAASEAFATSLGAPPFMPAIPDTDPAGLGAQGAAVAQAGAEAPGNAASTVSGATSNLGSMSSGASSLGGAVTAPAQAMTQIPQMLGQLAQPGMLSSMANSGNMFGSFLPGFAGGASGFSSLGSFGSGGGMPSPGVAASMGSGGSLPSGRLSIPASWANNIDTTSIVRPLDNSGPKVMSEQPETFGSGNSARAMPMSMMGGHSSGGTTGVIRGEEKRRYKPMVF